MTDQITTESLSSKIPIKLQLAEGEPSSLEESVPLYFSAPRQGYLHVLLSEALPLLHHLLPHVELTPWFSTPGNQLPLKWHLPLGVLHDLLNTNNQRPWHIQVHFRNYPSDVLLPYSDDNESNTHKSNTHSNNSSIRNNEKTVLWNSLKEAAFICQGSSGSQKVMEMSAGAQLQYWKGVTAENIGQYIDVHKSLDLEPVQRGGGGGGRVASVPVRLLIRKGRGYVSSYQGITYTSRPVPVYKQEEEEEGEVKEKEYVTLKDAVNMVLQEMHGDTDSKLIVEEEEGEGCNTTTILIGGIRPPLDSPIAWVHDKLHNVDHFLYIVVITAGN